MLKDYFAAILLTIIVLVMLTIPFVCFPGTADTTLKGDTTDYNLRH